MFYPLISLLKIGKRYIGHKKKNSFDTDDTSSSKSPDTNEPLTDNIEEIKRQLFETFYEEEEE